MAPFRQGIGNLRTMRRTEADYTADCVSHLTDARRDVQRSAGRHLTQEEKSYDDANRRTLADDIRHARTVLRNGIVTLSAGAIADAGVVFHVLSGKVFTGPGTFAIIVGGLLTYSGIKSGEKAEGLHADIITKHPVEVYKEIHRRDREAFQFPE